MGTVGGGGGVSTRNRRRRQHQRMLNRLVQAYIQWWDAEEKASKVFWDHMKKRVGEVTPGGRLIREELDYSKVKREP